MASHPSKQTVYEIPLGCLYVFPWTNSRAYDASSSLEICENAGAAFINTEFLKLSKYVKKLAVEGSN